MEKSHGWIEVCVSKKSDPGDDHPGSLCGPAGRRDSVDADFRRSDSALRAGWPWLAASNASDRCLCNGAGRSAPAADEAGWPNLALVCVRIWNCDHSVWSVQNILVIARALISYRRVR